MEKKGLESEEEARGVLGEAAVLSVEALAAHTAHMAAQAASVAVQVEHTRIDPYGQYHRIRWGDESLIVGDADWAPRSKYGSRPLASEPHIVMEYRELDVSLDKTIVRRLANGSYLTKTYAEARAEVAVPVAQLDAAARRAIQDDTAAAHAAAQAHETSVSDLP